MAVWLAVCMFWSCYAGMSYWHTCAVSGVQCHGVWCDGVQLLMHGHSYGSLTCTAPPSHSFIVTACSLPLSPTPLFARMEPTTHRSRTLTILVWYQSTMCRGSFTELFMPPSLSWVFFHCTCKDSELFSTQQFCCSAIPTSHYVLLQWITLHIKGTHPSGCCREILSIVPLWSHDH